MIFQSTTPDGSTGEKKENVLCAHFQLPTYPTVFFLGDTICRIIYFYRGGIINLICKETSPLFMIVIFFKTL